MKKPFYMDLGDLEEEKRIAMIGHQAQDHGRKVAFIVDDDAKADRYIRKLLLDFKVKVLERGYDALGVKKTVWVKVGPA